MSHVRVPQYIGTTPNDTKLKLHEDAVTQGFALMGKRRRGKSNLMGCMMETLAARGQSFVCIDPADAHWGIRYAIDDEGRPSGPSGLDVLVVGGDHADVPLDPTAGRELARTIVAGDISCVICLKALNYTKLQSFCADFGEELFMLNRTPRHIFFDECQNLLPQNLKFEEQKRVLYAMSKIVAEGGGNGLGFTLASQRPSKVNKDVLEEVDNFIVLGMIGPLDLKQIRNWFEHHVGDEGKLKDIIDSVASLPVGDCWFLSPDWMKEITRFHARLRVTYHSGRTPRPGERPVNVAKFTVPEAVEHLKKLFAAKETKRREEVESLNAAKKRIRELEKELRSRPVPKVQPAAARVVVDSRAIRQAVRKAEDYIIAQAKIEIGVLKQEIFRFAKSREAFAPTRMEIPGGEIQSKGAQRQSAGAQTAAQIEHPRPDVYSREEFERDRFATAGPYKPLSGLASERAERPSPRSSSNLEARSNDSNGDSNGDGELTPYQRDILRGLAELQAIGRSEVPRGLAAAAAGKSHKSSTFEKYSAALRTAGLIEYRGSKLALTDSGHEIAPRVDASLTTEDVQARVLRILTPYKREIVQALIDAGGETLTWDEVGGKTGKSPGSSTFEKYMAELRSAEIIEYCGSKRAKAADWLFLE